MTITDPKIISRMRKEAHKRLDDILDAKEMWYYPIVATVIVEAPGIKNIKTKEKK